MAKRRDAAARRATDKRRQAARRARVAARQQATRAPFLPPVAPLSTQVPAVATEVRPVPTAAIAWLLAGVALFLTAGLLPDHVVSPHGREVPPGMRLGARLVLGTLGLTGILVGFVMIIAAA
jgi:hypothetical protein